MPKRISLDLLAKLFNKPASELESLLEEQGLSNIQEEERNGEYVNTIPIKYANILNKIKDGMRGKTKVSSISAIVRSDPEEVWSIVNDCERGEGIYTEMQRQRKKVLRVGEHDFPNRYIRMVESVCNGYRPGLRQGELKVPISEAARCLDKSETAIRITMRQNSIRSRAQLNPGPGDHILISDVDRLQQLYDRSS